MEKAKFFRVGSLVGIWASFAIGYLSGLSGLERAYADSVPELREACGPSIKSSSPAANGALTTMLSLQHVRHSLSRAAAAIENPVYCVSGLALSRNAYQYVQYYFQIDVRSGGEPTPAYRFRYLFQNASVQAYHNYLGQPWTGLAPSKADEILRTLAQSARFAPASTFSEESGFARDPLAIAKLSKTFAASRSNVDETSVSVLPLPSDSLSGRTVHLVTWLTRTSADPFAGFTLTMGVLVAVDGEGNVSLAENVLPTTNVLIPISDAITGTMATLPAREDWASLLLRMSDVKSN